MGVSFQAYSISADLFGRFSADASAASRFVMQHYCKDEVGDGFEAVWLDKSGMGILEAFGVMDGSAEPPATWVLGAGDVLSLGEEVCAFLTPDQTRSVAEWISTVSESEFAERAESNTIDDDVEYLTSWFSSLSGLYSRAAKENRAVLVYFSG